MEFEEEKGSLLLLQEELSLLKNEKETSEKDFNERLSEYEKNFERTIDDYEKRIEEQDKVAEELKTASEKTKEQMAKMKKQFQAKLKSVREGQSSSGAVDVSFDLPIRKIYNLSKYFLRFYFQSELATKCSTLENRIVELEEEKGNNLWIQEELAQIKQEKEALEGETAAKILHYQNQIEELKNTLEQSAQQINQLQIQAEKESQNSNTQAEVTGQSVVNFFGDASSEGGWEVNFFIVLVFV